MQLGRPKAMGRLGLNFVERIALEACAKPIPVPEDLDTGIDGFIEWNEPQGVSRLIAFQVKHGASYWDKGGACCRVSAEQLQYWGQYAVPVFLVVVRADRSGALCMDVRDYVRQRDLADIRGSSMVLRPCHPFDPAVLGRTIRDTAEAYEFGAAITGLTDVVATVRLGAVAHLYRFRRERRTLFCLAAGLRTDVDPVVLCHLCDFYSRYLSHPEASFADLDVQLVDYAKTLLADFPATQLVRLLGAFGADEEEFGAWDGVVEIFGMTEAEIWSREDIVARGSLQQGIAQVMLYAAPMEALLAIVTDVHVSLSARCGAVALLGYLGYSCDAERVNGLLSEAREPQLRALLTWWRYWVVSEQMPPDG